MYESSDNGMTSDHRSRVRAMALWGVLVAAGSCAAALATAGTETNADARNLTQEQIAVYTTQAPMAAAPTPGTQPLSVVAWVDRADTTYAVGQHVRLFVRANKEAYLTVLNVGASRHTTVLFPNPYQPQIRVAAHQVAEIPPPGSGASIRVSGPTGRELIKVIASTHPTPFGAGGMRSAPNVMPEADPRTPGRDMQMMPNDGAAQEWADYTTIITTIGSRTGTAVPTMPVVPLVPAPQGTAWPSAGFGLRVATGKPVYRIGEPVSVHASATAPCYLTLVNVGSSGQVRVLVPNAAQPQLLIPAGQTVAFPMSGSNLRLAAMGPPGTETVVAVCSADNRPVFPSGLPRGRSGLAALRDLAVAAAGPSGHRPLDRASVEFMVTL